MFDEVRMMKDCDQVICSYAHRDGRAAQRWGVLYITLLALLTCSWLAAPVFAQDSTDASTDASTSTDASADTSTTPDTDAKKKDPFDLTLHRADDDDKDNWIRPSISYQTAMFTTKKAYGGHTRANVGSNLHGWIEQGLVPAVDAQFSLKENGMLRSRISVAWSGTYLGTDGAGSTLNNQGHANNQSNATLEDAYLGWTSGNLFADSLGKDAVDLSFGSQSYQIGPSGPDGDGYGSGFLFYNAGADGQKRGGFWLGLRNSFQITGMAKLNTGELNAEVVYLRSDELSNVNTSVVGTRLVYDLGKVLDMKFARLSGGYYYLPKSDDDRRDGLNVVNLGLDVKPLADILPGLRFAGEFVYENNSKQNKSWALWADVGYTFENASWKPMVSYRYAKFTGDNDGGSNNNFDPLFYGFNDWNEWYLGEISGEYLTQNANLEAHIWRVKSSPLDSLTLNFFWIYQRLDNTVGGGLSPRPPISPKAGNIQDKDLSHEIDFIADYTFNKHLQFSLVAAYLFPLSGGEDFFGGDSTWQNYMLWTNISF